MSFFITSLANTELNEDFTVSEYLRITFGKPTFIVNPSDWQTADTLTTYITRLTKPVVAVVVNPPVVPPVVTDTTPPVISFSDGWTNGDTVQLTLLPTPTTDDASPVITTFDTVFNGSVASSYTYTYTSTDSAGNVTTVNRVYVVPVPNTTPPIIIFSDSWVSGTTEILTGGIPNVSATDDSGETISVTIAPTDEQFPFDVNTTGLYQYVYTATDSSCNSTIVIRSYQAYGAPTFHLGHNFDVLIYGTNGNDSRAITLSLTQ
jgi:hypothetical protein